jgi:hypothetical protein
MASPFLMKNDKYNDTLSLQKTGAVFSPFGLDGVQFFHFPHMR